MRFCCWLGHSANPVELKTSDARTPAITPRAKAQVLNRNPANIVYVKPAESRVPLPAKQERTLSFYVCGLSDFALYNGRGSICSNQPFLAEDYWSCSRDSVYRIGDAEGVNSNPAGNTSS